MIDREHLQIEKQLSYELRDQLYGQLTFGLLQRETWGQLRSQLGDQLEWLLRLELRGPLNDEL
jgi:hypothetical protein